MSDNPTRETPDSRSFEERVFARFDSLDERMNRFESRLDSLETKVDARLRETRPIWEAVLTRLDGVENRLGGIEKEIRDVGRGVELLHKDCFQVRIKQEELRERVEKLESQSTP